MKRFLVLITVALVTASLLAGCAGEAKTYTDSGQTINISQGNGFVIALGSNQTTGYSWQASYDESRLELVESKYELGKTAEQGVVGTGGVEFFKFRALSKGTTEITMVYQRPWEEESLDRKLFTVNIN